MLSNCFMTFVMMIVGRNVFLTINKSSSARSLLLQSTNTIFFAFVIYEQLFVAVRQPELVG